MSLASRVLPLACGLSMAAAAPLLAQMPTALDGTWKLNLAKSTYRPANLAPKSGTTKYTVTKDQVTGVTDGVDSKGRTTHSEYSATCDGKDHPWVGTIDGRPNPDQDAVRAKCISARTYHVTNKLKGKALTTIHIVVAKDGKTRTVSTTGKNAQGIAVNNKALYEKQ